MAEMRGFASAADMDEAIVENWNSTVPKGHTVYVLGDISFAKPGRTIDLLQELHGRLILVRGNHDRHFKDYVYQSRFESWHDFLEQRIDGKQVIMCHYPLAVWRNSHYGTWHLHGHSHGSLAERGRRLDVGMDVHGLRPVSFEQVREIMDKRVFHKEDYHDAATKEDE